MPTTYNIYTSFVIVRAFFNFFSEILLTNNFKIICLVILYTGYIENISYLFLNRKF